MLRAVRSAAMSDMPKLCWIFICACLFLAVGDAGWAASSARPQNNTRYTIDVWENDDGLPQNSIISMTQTRDGYLWLGTVNGLVRFDGMRFAVFNEDNAPGLGSSPIVKLFEDSRGGLWIGTELEGVVLAKDGKVTRLGIGRGSREGRLTAICEDSAGAIWLCTADGQLWRYREGVMNTFLTASGHPGGYGSVVADIAGRLWVGSDKGILLVNPEADFSGGELTVERTLVAAAPDFMIASRGGGFWSFSRGSIERWSAEGVGQSLGSFALGSSRLTSACEDHEGNLLVGTLGQGVAVFERSGRHSLISTNEGLSGSLVLSLQMDSENTLWVGTDGSGLNRLKRRTMRVVEQSRGLTVRSVSADAQGGVWMSFNALSLSADGAGYFKDGSYGGFGRDRGLLFSTVSSVLVDRRQRVWAGTQGGLFQLGQSNFNWIGRGEIIPPVIMAMHEDRQGQLWLGTRSGLVRWEAGAPVILTTRDGLSGEEVSAIADDQDGTLWIGTRGRGLNRLRDGRITALHKTDGLPGEDISSLYVDGEGALWVGTSGGLGRFKNGRWTSFSTRDGLVSNTIGYVIEDDKGYLWIGSNAGLMRVKKKELEDFAEGRATNLSFRSFGKPDGMPTRECTLGYQPGSCRTSDGRLWFPTSKGLVYVNPAEIALNTNPPPVVIESVLIDGKPQMAEGIRSLVPPTLSLSPRQERLEIEYTSLNLSSPDRARFRYRMEGHESAWIEADDVRVARYSKLPPGEYRFQVIAANEDGVWNETGSSLAFIVQPPFWRTWWFLGVVFASILGMVAGVVHYVSTQKLQRQLADLRQQEALEKERSRIARDIHDQLGANLTQVSLLGELVESDKDQPEEVSLHAKQISQAALETSRALDEIVWTVNPQNDTLDGLVNYICKYAQEYLAVAGLRYRLEVPPQLPDVSITPELRHNAFLVSKEAVTNVVRHAQATSVWIRLKLEPRQFTLEIQDDGKGPAGKDEKRAQSRNGLRNMSKRMEDVGGSFEIGPAPERGTLVRLTAPFGKR